MPKYIAFDVGKTTGVAIFDFFGDINTSTITVFDFQISNIEYMLSMIPTEDDIFLIIEKMPENCEAYLHIAIDKIRSKSEKYVEIYPAQWKPWMSAHGIYKNPRWSQHEIDAFSMLTYYCRVYEGEDTFLCPEILKLTLQ